jgi:ABC-2 type transport system ATP-binding protein
MIDSTNTSQIFKVSGISKRYPKAESYSLTDVSFDVIRGEKLGIFGPNGAGKTTLISILSGILPKTSGEVSYYIDNQSTDFIKILPKIVFVPQDFALYQELTAKQNLSYFGKMHGLKNPELEEKITTLLKILGLDHVGNRKLASFSGGMKRRINLAIGLINDPEILFLDEPTVGVDVQSKVAIMTLLNELNAKGTTMIYTSHHLREAEDFCDRTLLLDDGRIIAEGTLHDLLEQHNADSLEDLLINLTGKALRD